MEDLTHWVIYIVNSKSAPHKYQSIKANPAKIGWDKVSFGGVSYTDCTGSPETRSSVN